MPPSLDRVQVWRRGPYCWDRWRYSEKDAWEAAVKSEGRESVGEAGWTRGVWSTVAIGKTVSIYTYMTRMRGSWV